MSDATAAAATAGIQVDDDIVFIMPRGRRRPRKAVQEPKLQVCVDELPEKAAPTSFSPMKLKARNANESAPTGTPSKPKPRQSPKVSLNRTEMR